MKETWSDRIAKNLFILAIAFSIFILGMAVGKYRLFPYSLLQNGKASLTKLLGMSGEEWRPHQLMPTWYKFSGVRPHQPERMMPGVTLVTGYWKETDWKQGIRLIDSEGNTLHHWLTDPEQLWESVPYNDYGSRGQRLSRSYVHGSYLFPNGDVLFNLEYLGLVRMDASGQIKWKLNYRTHHSVTRDDSGAFWVCGLKWQEDSAKSKYPGLKTPIGVDYAVQIAENGEVMREIDLLEVLYNSGNQHLIWQMSKRTGEILHANDIEPLSAEMADQYPMFEANDLLVSCRYINSVFVVDNKTEKIKWISSGFSQQHDPDFLGDGSISIFDNNYDGSSDGSYLGGTRIVRIWPETGEQDHLYPKNESQHFYTPFGGKVQLLENKNLLITEAGRCRTFEIDSVGQTVWEWTPEAYDEKYTPEIMEGSRYPYTVDEISAWK